MPSLLSHLEQRRFGPRVGIHRILDLLDRFALKGTFFVPGVVAEDHPDLLPLLVEKGHEVGLHGYFHELASDISDAAFTHALEASVSLFEAQTGARPKGFRSPAWEMTPHMLAELKRLGFYDSSLMGYDHPYTIAGVTRSRSSGSRTTPSTSSSSAAGWTWPPRPRPILEGWLDEWEVLHRYGGLLMLTVHDWTIGPRAAHRHARTSADADDGGKRCLVGDGLRGGHASRSKAGGPVRGRGGNPAGHRKPTRPKWESDADLDVNRGEIVSEHGLVAAQNMEAAAAGGAVLARGGNAVDAAVVTALMLATVEPWLSGIGGGGFLLYADGASGALSALDFSVRAPAGLDPDDYPLTGGEDGNWFDWPAVEEDCNIIGYSSICVPGTIDGLAQALERFGTLLLERGARARHRGCRARHGHRLVLLALHRHRRASAAPFSCHCRAISARRRCAARLVWRDLSADAGPSCAAPAAPRIRRPRLLRGQDGGDAGGRSARTRIGRVLEDFSGYHARWREAELGLYRGRTMAVVPGLGGGPSLLRAFALLEKAWQPGSAPDADAALAYAVAIRNFVSRAAEPDGTRRPGRRLTATCRCSRPRRQYGCSDEYALVTLRLEGCAAAGRHPDERRA